MMAKDKKVSGDMTDKIDQRKGAKPVRPADGTALAREIDENLRKVYAEKLKEEVPDRFAQLLLQLREKEAGK